MARPELISWWETVRGAAVLLESEVGTQSAHASLSLIQNQRHAPRSAQFFQTREVPWRGYDDAAGADDGLGNDGGRKAPA